MESKLWIDNRDVDALSRETFQTMNPATGAPLATLPVKPPIHPSDCRGCQ